MIVGKSDLYSECVGSHSPALDHHNAVAVFSDGNLGVAMITPVRAPRVLDDVVAGSVADGSHGVVGMGRAARVIVDDTHLIVVPNVTIGSDTHAGRTTGDTVFETGNRGLNKGFASNFGASSLRLASAFFTRVGVLGHFRDWVCHSILEHGSEVTAIASFAFGAAVKDLLLGERDGLSGLLVPTAFNASNAGENPA